MKRVRRAQAAARSLLLVLAVSGCDGVVASSPQEQALFDALESEWSKVQLAPYLTRFQGDRRVEFTVEVNGELRTIGYVERVSCDGNGNFNVLPLFVESNVGMDPVTFLIQQEGREGFFYRYRDFAVRDVDAFLQNFVVLKTSFGTVVAGRSCWTILIQRQGAEGVDGRLYRVSVDDQTGLVLGCTELDANGNVLAELEYITFDDSPDLGAVTYYVPGNDEQWLDPATDDVAAVLGFEPREPAALPAGFVPYETSTVEDADGNRWLKRGYTDGVELLFFLYREVQDSGNGYQLPKLSSGGTSRADALPDEVLVYTTGSVTVAQGRVGGGEYIAVGQVGEAALLDMIESAL
jgi:hypothetical protein